MKILDIRGYLRLILRWVACLTVGQMCVASASASDETFDTLQIGTRTYRNVTVTTKSKEYVFILHSAGMTNLKVTELPPEVRLQLGYSPPAPPPQTNNVAKVWAQDKLNKLESNEQFKGMRAQLLNWWQSSVSRVSIPPISQRMLLIGGGIFVLLYLFHCYCCSLICRKAGVQPGVLVWLPILQLLPLLRAAGMSAWWFLAYFVPLLNLVAHILWCFNIARARAKNFLLGLCLVLPVTSLLAFLYLAFSEGSSDSSRERPKRSSGRIEIMTLDTA